ncbi:Leucine-rich repeat containing protein [Entamoeba marina]
MSRLETIYLMNVVLYFTTKRAVVDFVKINKKCYDAVKGLHRAPNITTLSLSTALRMFQKIQHISGDLLSFQSTISLKQLERVKSFENEDPTTLTPIESIHKAFVGRVKRINIQYPFPDLIKFKKLEEIRICLSRDYLPKKQKNRQMVSIDANDFNEKIRYLRMLKRIVFYGVDVNIFEKNFDAITSIHTNAHIYIHSDVLDNNKKAQILPDNITLIVSKINSVTPNIVCIPPQQHYSISMTMPQHKIKAFIKDYYPFHVDLVFPVNFRPNLLGFDISFLTDCKVKHLMIHNFPNKLIGLNRLTNLYSLDLFPKQIFKEVYLADVYIHHLSIDHYYIQKVVIPETLETLHLTGIYGNNFSISASNKQSLSIISDRRAQLNIQGINSVKINGQGIVYLSKCTAQRVESNNVSLELGDRCFSSIQNLTIKNTSTTDDLNLSFYASLKTLCIINSKYQLVTLPKSVNNIDFGTTAPNINEDSLTKNQYSLMKKYLN